MRVARDLHARMQSLGQQSASLADYNPLGAVSQRLFDLGQILGKTHYESRKQLLTHANQTLIQLRWLVLASFGLLFVFALALAGVVYREMIAPLRVNLVERQNLA